MGAYRQFVIASTVAYILRTGEMHGLYLYLLWMVYILLIMGVLKAATDRTQNLRGPKTALIGGAPLPVVVSIGIRWFGPLDSFGA